MLRFGLDVAAIEIYDWLTTNLRWPPLIGFRSVESSTSVMPWGLAIFCEKVMVGFTLLAVPPKWLYEDWFRPIKVWL